MAQNSKYTCGKTESLSYGFQHQLIPILPWAGCFDTAPSGDSYLPPSCFVVLGLGRNLGEEFLNMWLTLNSRVLQNESTHPMCGCQQGVYSSR